jgi:hypothetical protein
MNEVTGSAPQQADLEWITPEVTKLDLETAQLTGPGEEFEP